MICNNRCNNWNCSCTSNCSTNCGCSGGCSNNCWNNGCWNNYPHCWPHYPYARPWDRWPGNRWPAGQNPGRPGPVGPMGPAGPAGPMGPAAPTVYGGLINNTAQTLTFTTAAAAVAPLTVQLPSDGVAYTPANSITVREAGDYAITYLLANAEAVGAADADITLTVRANGVPLTNTAITTAADAEDTIYLQGETIQTLAAGTVLDMTITPTVPLGLTLGDNTTIALIVRKLG